jgi:hypothetical protein
MGGEYLWVEESMTWTYSTSYNETNETIQHFILDSKGAKTKLKRRKKKYLGFG